MIKDITFSMMLTEYFLYMLNNLFFTARNQRTLWCNLKQFDTSYLSSVNPNTLWSYFQSDISVTGCHLLIKLYMLYQPRSDQPFSRYLPETDSTEYLDSL